MNAQAASNSPLARIRLGALLGGLSLVTLLLGGGCGPELDSLSDLKSLRVLGVQKSAPYARPGETVEMRMLWQDASEEAPRDVQSFFGFWCLNPPGDLYASCFATPPAEGAGFDFQTETFSFRVPDDALRTSPDPRVPPYGLAYVFFGLCAGELEFLGSKIPGAISSGNMGGMGGAPAALPLPPAAGAIGGAGGAGVGELPPAGDFELPPGTSSSLLPRCLDAEGNELGSEDFVLGYSSIYIYEELRNKNPLIDGIEIKGEPVVVDCIGADCAGSFTLPDTDGCVDGYACLKACEESNDDDCPEIDVEVIVSSESAERDDLSRVAYGNDIEEAIWVVYHSQGAELTADSAAINDSLNGWQPDPKGELRAPRKSGWVGVWAVVRDNRGGANWVRTPVYFK